MYDVKITYTFLIYKNKHIAVSITKWNTLQNGIFENKIIWLFPLFQVFK